tara:strand:+ start:743 stop:2350 length:1608 start_codon:yes stop_codon:yes gene_type:complete
MEASQTNEPVQIMEPKQSKECEICIEIYTKIKSRVQCSKCDFECCKHCVQEYLLHQTNMEEPHCMKCREQWNDEFLYNKLNKTFINSIYRKSYKERLFNIEKSRIPETMNMVENYKKTTQIRKENQTISETIKLLIKQIRELDTQKSQNVNQLHYYEQGQTPPNEEKSQEKNEKRQFIHNCPTEDCKGFLSSAWKCNVCENWACSKCFEGLGPSKDPNHTCQEDQLKSAQLIKKETHPCPKCAVPIFKISGCDQMWCTQCTIAFSWKTGKIITNRTMHNPHYYQYIRQGGHAPRNPGDVVCGGLPTYHLFTRHLKNIQPILHRISKYQQTHSKYFVPPGFPIGKYANIYEDLTNPNSILITEVKNIITQFVTYYRSSNHNSHVTIHNFRRKNQNIINNNTDRIKYILNEINEERFKTIVSTKTRKLNKNTRILHVFELFNTIITETLNNINELCLKGFCFVLTNETELKIIPENFIKIHHYLNELANHKKRCIHIANYCNEELEKIAKQYNTKPFKISIKSSVGDGSRNPMVIYR